MSFTAKISPLIALVGNPILVIVDTNQEESIRIKLEYAGDIYEAGAIPNQTGQCVFCINDVLQTYFIHLLPVFTSELFSALPGTVLDYKVIITGNTNTLTLTGKCYPGGISNRLFRQLAARNTDIFSEKLLNAETNFFLTTRTNNGIIPIRETELGYLYFIGNGHDITIADLHNKQQVITPGQGKSIYVINMIEVRRKFFEAGSFSSYFQIISKNRVVAIVVILPSTPDSTVLMFKNSFGVFERIEFAGVLNMQPDIKKQSISSGFDQSIWNFVSISERGGYCSVMNIESGYRSKEELQFIQDLLISEEVYLLLRNEQIRILVSSTKMKYRQPITEPTSVEIKITFCDQEQFVALLPEFNEEGILTNKNSQSIITSSDSEIIINKIQA